VQRPAHAEDDLAVLKEAVRALVERGVEDGRRALRPIAGAVWSTSIQYAPVVRKIVSDQSAQGSRAFTATRTAQVLVRDSFTCRYCGGRIVPRRLLVALSSIYPAEVPYYVHYKLGTVHRVYWTLAAEADHLHAGARGGSWRDVANHVTACVYCNTRKSSRLLEEIGWRLQPARERSWDGLTASYREIWRLAGQPAPTYHRPFIAALERARVDASRTAAN